MMSLRTRRDVLCYIMSAVFNSRKVSSAGENVLFTLVFGMVSSASDNEIQMLIY